MSHEITNLNPKPLWENFYSLTQIPRPSKHEDKIRAFLKQFGMELGLETFVDGVGNVIIRKPATPGMENRKGVVLQAHMDMVPQKNNDTVHNFVTDPIQPYIDGEWVKAKGTTLGADNGVGLAAAMAVLQAKDIAHGPVEVLVTTDEETGMTGAFGLQPGILKGDILLNLDSEDEGELYVGCAGGIDANAFFRYEKVAVPQNVDAYKLIIKGLKGGHSGLDIILQRGNANKMLVRYLRHAAIKHGMRLAHIEGGSLRNAIPRESSAVFVIPKENSAKIKECVIEQFDKIAKELSATEPDMEFRIEPAEMPAFLIDEKTQANLINSVYACPNGVMRMSDAMKGLVETSTNLAIIKMDEKEINVACLLRSSVDSAKDDLAQMISSVFELADARVDLSGAYPGWKPNMESPILTTMQDVYQKLYGKIPEIKAIHAGLECGLLAGAYPHWDMISFGPTMRFPHSPDEKLNIPTVEKFWNYLVETLKNIPVK